MSADAELLYDVWAETAEQLSQQWQGSNGPRGFEGSTGSTMTKSKKRTPRPPRGRVADPNHWWRTLCWVTPQIALSGDLPEGYDAKRRGLQEWVQAGITHVVDTRLEHSDESFVRDHAPRITYTWAGVDDHGGRQPDAWFDHGVAGVLAAVDDPSAKVVVHCHMGVNRGPSMGFAAMLATGHDPIKALSTIRIQRPIAAVLYAEDAIGWWYRRQRAGREAIFDDVRAVRSWHQANPIDTDWITSRIWRSGG